MNERTICLMIDERKREGVPQAGLEPATSRSSVLHSPS
jgi:hypothetical protein